MIIYTLIGIFTVLQILDIWTTYTVITKCNGVEQNPIMDKIISWLGLLPALIVTKIIAVCLVIYISTVYPLLLIAFVVLYTVVIIHNYKSMPR